LTNWLIPWTSRGKSGAVSENLLWRSGRVYVMDNHRLALWCWWQHFAEAECWEFFHVDRHYDSLWQKFDPWPVNTTAQHRKDLEAFRSATVHHSGADLELYRWDTVTSALYSLHSNALARVRFATGDEGDRPQIPAASFVRPWSVPGVLRDLAQPAEDLAYPQIIDIDVDYFTYHDLDGAFGQVFSDTYILEIGESLRQGLDSGRFGVVTIALSPDTTGSWPLAERILGLLLSKIGGLSEFRAGTP
jgi:hypothetical protein